MYVSSAGAGAQLAEAVAVKSDFVDCCTYGYNLHLEAVYCT
jgi:hypothetical protein